MGWKTAACLALMDQLKAPRALDALSSLFAPNNLSEVHSGVQQQELWRVTKRLNVPRGCEQSLSKLKQSVILTAVGGHRAPSPPSCHGKKEALRFSLVRDTRLGGGSPGSVPRS